MNRWMSVILAVVIGMTLAAIMVQAQDASPQPFVAKWAGTALQSRIDFNTSDIF